MRLPRDRQIITGRTFRQSWDARDFDPFEGPQPAEPTWIAWFSNAICWACALALFAAMLTAPQLWRAVTLWMGSL